MFLKKVAQKGLFFVGVALSWWMATARVDGYPVVHLTSILLLFLLVSSLLYIISL